MASNPSTRSANRRQISIAMMGGTGTGKTTFLNLVGHAQYLRGDDLSSCTDQVQSHQFAIDDCDVTLIDTPGFDDTNKSDTDVLKMITDFLVVEYESRKLLSGVMYFHRISDVRMGGASRRNFTMFKKLCGEHTFANIAIVTTRWDQEDEAIAKSRLTELETKPQMCKSILDGGGKIFQHDRSYDSGLAILRHLISNVPKPLLIQRELVDETKPLTETAAGQELQQDILKQVERHQREMTELIKEMEQTAGASDLKELEEECRVLRERTAYLDAEAHKLALTSTQRERESLPTDISSRLCSDSISTPISLDSHSSARLTRRAEVATPDDKSTTVITTTGRTPGWSQCEEVNQRHWNDDPKYLRDTLRELAEGIVGILDNLLMLLRGLITKTL